MEGMCPWIRNIIRKGFNRKRGALMGAGFNSNPLDLKVGSLGAKLRTDRHMLHGHEHVIDLSGTWSSH